MNRIYIFIFIVSVLSVVQGANANSHFISSCLSKTQSKSLKSHIEWLNILLKTKNCFLMSEKIKKMKSIGELVPGHSFIITSPQSSWVDDFPYMYGLADYEGLDSREIAFVNFQLVSETIDIYKEFKNLIHIPYTDNFGFFNKTPLCKILQNFKSIREVTLAPETLEDSTNDKCLYENGINVIIRGTFNGFNRMPLAKIVGFETYQDTFEKLNQYPYLQYLGISEYLESQGSISTLAKSYNITHLSMNTSGIRKLSALSNLVNLSHLTLNCTSFTPEGEKVEIGCFKNQITDISFLKKLIWLKHINLNSNFVNDLTPIRNLINLESIELSYNDIYSVPDLSKLKKLKHLDLSNNKLENLSKINTAKNLVYLNVSGNLIHDFDGVKEFKFLRILDMSDNLFQGNLKSFIVPDSLKLLNISGSRTKPQLNSSILLNFHTYIKKGHPLESYHYKIVHDYRYTNDIPDKPFVSDGIDFKKFKNIEVLIMKNNNLKDMPNLTDAKKLKFIDLEHNNIEFIPQYISNSSLESLDLSGNKFKSFPNLSNFPLAQSVDLIKNQIEDISNLNTLTPKNSQVVLEENKIESIGFLNSEKYQEMYFVFGNNPIRINETDCPRFTKNITLGSYCIEKSNGTN